MASQDKVVPVKTSQEKIVPEKKEVPKEQETEERGSQDDAMETESEVGNKQQQQQPVGPVRPVSPPVSAPPPPEVHTIIVIFDHHITLCQYYVYII